MDVLFPPGPQKHLLLGNSVEFRNDPLATMVDAARDYGEIVHFRFGPSHAYLVTNAEYIHYVLVERPDLFDAQHHLYRAVQSALGHELFAPDDGVYKRTKSPQPLPRNWLEAQANAITDSALEVLSGWEDGDVIDLYQELEEITLRIAATTLFGSEPDPTIQQLAAATPYSRTLYDRRFSSPWTMRWAIADRAQNIVRHLIRNRRINTPGADALSLLETEPLSERQVVSRLVRLFGLMHETAATTLTWALVLLGQYPEITDALYAELDAVIGDTTPTADHLAQLVYTEMVLHETMRLYPPAWLVSRQTRTEARIGCFFLPAGSTVLCSPYIMQRSPRNFVEPEKFLPERFGDGYERRTRRYAYAPFGVSAALEETTLLSEMKLLLAVLVRRFHFVQEVNHPIKVDPLVTLRPKDKLPIRVKRRVAASQQFDPSI